MHYTKFCDLKNICRNETGHNIKIFIQNTSLRMFLWFQVNKYFTVKIDRFCESQIKIQNRHQVKFQN